MHTITWGTNSTVGKALRGVLSARIKDCGFLTEHLLFMHVKDGVAYCSDGARIHYAAIAGLPEDGLYEVKMFSRKAMFLPVNPEAVANICSLTLTEKKPVQFQIFKEQSVSQIAMKAKMHVNYKFVSDAIGPCKSATARKERVELNGCGGDCIYIDNGYWKSIIMPMRDRSL